MNIIFIIGRLTRYPVLKQTKNGIDVCEFDVAVNSRWNANGDQETTYFKVTAWRGLAAICSTYLSKGKKVAVVGSLKGRAYADKTGTPRASLEITADEVEFLSPRQEVDEQEAAYIKQEREGIQNDRIDQQSSFVQVDDDELPF